MQVRKALFSEDLKQKIEDSMALRSGEGNPWVSRDQEVALLPKFLDMKVNIRYYYNQSKNTVIIADPLATENNTIGEPTYQSVVDKIKAAHPDSNIIGTFIGTGSSILHYVSFIELANPVDAPKEIIVFDSKISNPSRFFSGTRLPNWFEKMTAFVTMPFNTLRRTLGYHKTELYDYTPTSDNPSPNDEPAPVIQLTVHNLGTQGMLDDVSCGYYSANTALKMVDLVDNAPGGGAIDKNRIEKAITTAKNLGQDDKTYVSHPYWTGIIGGILAIGLGIGLAMTGVLAPFGLGAVALGITVLVSAVTGVGLATGLRRLFESIHYKNPPVYQNPAVRSQTPEPDYAQSYGKMAAAMPSGAQHEEPKEVSSGQSVIKSIQRFWRTLTSKPAVAEQSTTAPSADRRETVYNGL